MRSQFVLFLDGHKREELASLGKITKTSIWGDGRCI